MVCGKGGVTRNLKVRVNCELEMKNGEADVLERLSRMLDTGKGSDFQFIVQGESFPFTVSLLKRVAPSLLPCLNKT